MVKLNLSFFEREEIFLCIKSGIFIGLAETGVGVDEVRVKGAFPINVGARGSERCGVGLTIAAVLSVTAIG